MLSTCIENNDSFLLYQSDEDQLPEPTSGMQPVHDLADYLLQLRECRTLTRTQQEQLVILRDKLEPNDQRPSRVPAQDQVFSQRQVYGLKDRKVTCPSERGEDQIVTDFLHVRKNSNQL